MVILYHFVDLLQLARPLNVLNKSQRDEMMPGLNNRNHKMEPLYIQYVSITTYNLYTSYIFIIYPDIPNINYLQIHCTQY